MSTDPRLRLKGAKSAHKGTGHDKGHRVAPPSLPCKVPRDGSKERRVVLPSLPSSEDADQSLDVSPVARMPLVVETLKKFQVAKVFHEHTDAINAMSFSSDGNHLVTSSEDDQLVVYSTQRCVSIHKIQSKKYGADLATFTHEQNMVLHASTKTDNMIRQLHVVDNRYTRYFDGHRCRLLSLRMNPKENNFLSCGDDKTVRLWEIRSHSCQGLLHLDHAAYADFDPQGLSFVVAMDNRVLNFYDMRSFDKAPFGTYSYQKHIEGKIVDVKCSPNGKYVMITTMAMVAIVDAFDGTLRRMFKEHRARPVETPIKLEACFSPCSKFVLTGSHEGKLFIYNIKNGKCVSRITAVDSAPMTTMKFCPKALMLASSCTATSFWVPTVTGDEKEQPKTHFQKTLGL